MFMIRDFFTNKIHASSSDWPDWLCAIAHIFSTFDGKPYDRSALIKKLEEWAPAHRYSDRKDVFFRDEITAYMSHLGIFRIRQEHGNLIFRLSETARAFLVGDEPNVGAFFTFAIIPFADSYFDGIAVR